MRLDDLLAQLQVYAQSHPDAEVRIVDVGVEKHLKPDWIVFGDHDGKPEARIMSREIAEIDFDWSARIPPPHPH